MKHSSGTRLLGYHAQQQMPEVLRDWLKDYKILRPSDIPAYAARIRKDERLCDAIHSIIENALPAHSGSGSSSDGGGGGGSCRPSTPGSSSNPTTDTGLLSSLCHQLFQFYRQTSEHPRGHQHQNNDDQNEECANDSASFPLRSFTLQFVPILVETYLFACSLGRGDAGGGGAHIAAVDVTPVETLLLSIYNLDVTHSNGRPKSSSFVLPSLSRASIYHDPTSLISSVALTESDLSRLEHPTNAKIITYGPFPHAEAFTARFDDGVMY